MVDVLNKCELPTIVSVEAGPIDNNTLVVLNTFAEQGHPKTSIRCQTARLEWSNSQDERHVKLLLVEDAQPSQQELPQLFFVDTGVVLSGAVKQSVLCF